MPQDTLRQEIEGTHRAAVDYIESNRPDEHQRRRHLKNLEAAKARLGTEIEERSTSYLSELDHREKDAINSRWMEVSQDPAYVRITAAQKAHQQTFEDLRQVNGGGYP